MVKWRTFTQDDVKRRRESKRLKISRQHRNRRKSVSLPQIIAHIPIEKGNMPHFILYMHKYTHIS